MSEYKEFWIHYSGDWFREEKPSDISMGNYFHVIEFSAYDDLKKQNDELRAQLEYCKESMCFHKGETRSGGNREWCFDCSSWVYPSDREMLTKIEGEKC